MIPITDQLSQQYLQRQAQLLCDTKVTLIFTKAWGKDVIITNFSLEGQIHDIPLIYFKYKGKTFYLVYQTLQTMRMILIQLSKNTPVSY